MKPDTLRSEHIAVPQNPSENNSLRPALSTRDMSSEDNRPATKQDLEVLRQDLHGDMDRLRDEMITEMHGSMDHLRDELVEKMRDMQTEVLRAFHDWARPVEIRLRTLPNIEERLGILEERVSAIERRGRI